MSTAASRVDQFLDRTRNIFDRDLRINSVLIEKINVIGPKSLQGVLSDLIDIFRPAV